MMNNLKKGDTVKVNHYGTEKTAVIVKKWAKGHVDVRFENGDSWLARPMDIVVDEVTNSEVVAQHVCKNCNKEQSKEWSLCGTCSQYVKSVNDALFSKPSTYEIRNIDDFLKIPSDRMQACFDEISKHLIQIKDMGLDKVDVLTWCDDGDDAFNVTLNCVDGRSKTICVKPSGVSANDD